MEIGKIELSIENISKEDTIKYQEILAALVGSGALRLKGAKVTIHLDGDGVFQGIQFDYWPYRRRSKKLCTG